MPPWKTIRCQAVGMPAGNCVGDGQESMRNDVQSDVRKSVQNRVQKDVKKWGALMSKHMFEQMAVRNTHVQKITKGRRRAPTGRVQGTLSHERIRRTFHLSI